MQIIMCPFPLLSVCFIQSFLKYLMMMALMLTIFSYNNNLLEQWR